jgi:hypothetical protein
MLQEWWTQAVSGGASLPGPELLVRLVLALVGGIAVAGLYRFTRSGAGAISLPATLVLLAVLIAAVTQVIGDNVARAFSLVGALSIVRFRTVVRDTRDTAFVIFAVVMGMGIGAGHTLVAVATLAVGGVAAWIMRPRQALGAESTEFELTLRIGLGADAEALGREAFPPHFITWKSRAASTARQGSALEVTWLVTLVAGVSPAQAALALNRCEGVLNVELQPREERN